MSTFAYANHNMMQKMFIFLSGLVHPFFFFFSILLLHVKHLNSFNLKQLNSVLMDNFICDHFHVTILHVNNLGFHVS